MRTVTRLYDNHADAVQVVNDLEAASIPHSDISIVANNRGDRYSPVAADTGTGAGTGATAGGILGGGVGLLAGIGLLAIPGVGPLIAAGPIMAALSGAAVGAATGGVVGGLIGLGIPEIEAKIYEEKLKTGNYLVSVHAHDGKEVDRAKEIYKSENAEDISTTSQATPPKP